MGYKYFKSSLYKKTIRQYLCGIVVREVVVLILPLALYVSYIRIAIHQSELLGFISLILLIFTIYFFLSNATRIQKYVLSTYFQLNQDYQETTKIGNHKILASHIENNFNYINDNSFTELHLAIKPLYFFILIYVIVTAIFSNFLAIVPIIIISIHWLILRLIHKKYNLCTQRCSLYLNRRYLFFTEIVFKNWTILQLHINHEINKKYNQLNLVYNKYKYHCLYLSNLTSSVTNGLVIVNFLALFILSKYFLEINHLNHDQVLIGIIFNILIMRILFKISKITYKIKTSDNGIADELVTKLRSSNFNNENLMSDDKKVYENITTSNSHPLLSVADAVNLQNIFLVMSENDFQVSFINSQCHIYRGSIMSNMTLFNESKNIEALAIMANIGTIASLANLTNTYDEILDHAYDEKINYELKLYISVVRELLTHPQYLLLDINRKLYSKNFIINLLNYCHRINIKLIIKDHFSIDLIKEDLSFLDNGALS